jgi:uncharacterized repeat protein (TIGR01451 family)
MRLRITTLVSCVFLLSVLVPTAGSAQVPEVISAEESAAVEPGRTAPVSTFPVVKVNTGTPEPEGLGAGGAPTDPSTNLAPSRRRALPGPFALLAPSDDISGVIEDFPGQDGVTPPDTVGDVGPDHYVQMVNFTTQIWDKAGNTLAGPFNTNTLWTANTVDDGKCDTQNAGDPIVLYDQLADRFMISQFSSPSSGAPFMMCIAYAQTADPTGAYFTYAFTLNDSNDYEKFGVWPDGLYMSVFENPENGAYVFDRDAMVAGAAATFQYFGDIPGGSQPRRQRILPSDWDGTTAPPAGAPNYFVQSVDGAFDATNDRLEIFEAHVDWAVPANSTFTNVTDLNTNAFSIDVGCTDDDGDGAFRNCVPQPNTTNDVDNLANRLMHRLQYRNFGTHESMVTQQTIDDGADRHIIRWYELRKVGANPWTIFQQGDYGPGTAHRWMGSTAMDKEGNIAIGYSISDPANGVFPSIAYTGRLADAPLGTLPGPEQTMFAGTASQTTSDRWGDYSALTVDPVDDCTFWYTQQHSGVGLTHIGSFRFDSCSQTDMQIVKSDSPDPVLAGGTLTYTLEVTNAGSNVATGVQVSDTLPAGGTVTFVNAASTQGTCSELNGVVTCEIGTMDPGAVVTVTITVTPTAAAVPTVSNMASVSAGNFDPETANNSDVEVTTVTPSADLSVSKTCVPDPVAPGGILTCSLEVDNAGPSTAESVVVTDDLAENTELQGTPAGAGFSCVSQASDPEISCTRASQPVGGATITYTLLVHEDSAPGSSFSNTSTVGSATHDPDTADNEDVETTSLPACTISGTGASEVINGTPNADVICAGAGNDVVNGLGGDDIVIGGPGNDLLSGGDGEDTVVGGPGNDQLSGGAGPDRQFGGPGNDRIDGNGGDDVMFGREDDDMLTGGAGTDTADGGPGSDGCSAETSTNC